MTIQAKNKREQGTATLPRRASPPAEPCHPGLVATIEYWHVRSLHASYIGQRGRGALRAGCGAAAGAAVQHRPVAAGARGAAIARAGGNGSGGGPQRGRQLVFLRWGLIPPWADDPAIGNRLINARAETAAEKPAFRAAFRQRRCLLVADGFYEWRRRASAKA